MIVSTRTGTLVSFVNHPLLSLVHLLTEQMNQVRIGIEGTGTEGLIMKWQSSLTLILSLQTLTAALSGKAGSAHPPHQGRAFWRDDIRLELDVIQVGIKGFLLAWPLPCPSLFSDIQPKRGCRGSQGHSWAQPPGRLRVTAELTCSQPGPRVLQDPQTTAATSAGLPLTLAAGSDPPGACGQERSCLSVWGFSHLSPAGCQLLAASPQCLPAASLPLSVPRLPSMKGAHTLHMCALPQPEQTQWELCPKGRAWNGDLPL